MLKEKMYMGAINLSMAKQEVKGKAKAWLKNERSAEETSSKGIWIFASAMVILIVVDILLAGSVKGYTGIVNTFVNITEDGVNTPEGEWSLNTPTW